MMKNRIAQTCGQAISRIASGNVMKVNPGPSLATFEIGTPMLFDRNPKIAVVEKFSYTFIFYHQTISPEKTLIPKTTNPAKTAVKKFTIETKTASKCKLFLNLLNDANVTRDPHPNPNE